MGPLQNKEWSQSSMADHTSLFIKMKLLCCFAFAAVACCATPPHIVFVLTDDNGWAGVGYNNPHVSTPTLDNLAAGGLKLTSHCKSRALCISHFASRADNRPPPPSPTSYNRRLQVLCAHAWRVPHRSLSVQAERNACQSDPVDSSRRHFAGLQHDAKEAERGGVHLVAHW